MRYKNKNDLFMGLKGKYPDIITGSFVKDFSEEDSRTQESRSELHKLGKTYLKENHVFLNSFSTLDDYNEYVQDLENKNDVIKMTYEKKIRLHEHRMTGELILNYVEICNSIGYDLLDVCNDYYLFRSSGNIGPKEGLFNLMIYNAKTQERTMHEDLVSKNKYFLKQNGSIYSIAEITHKYYLYDYETEKEIEIPFEYGLYQKNIAYGSKYIAYIDDNTCTVYNHSGSIISTLYVCHKCLYPTTIEGSTMTGYHFYASDYQNYHTEFKYDINVSARKRIKSLINCKQAVHIPKEVYQIIYSFIKL